MEVQAGDMDEADVLVELFDEDVDADGARRNEDGLATAELLGNAALGVLALVAIWALMQQLGVDIVEWIRGQLIG
jgi:hypothetical protein